jgi:hypothetical protein
LYFVSDYRCVTTGIKQGNLEKAGKVVGWGEWIDVAERK